MVEVHASRRSNTRSSPVERPNGLHSNAVISCCAMLATAVPLLFITPSAARGAEASDEAAQAEALARTRAARDTPNDPRKAIDRVFTDPLGGVVVNRTVTVLGKDFYQYFSTRWRQDENAARYAISIYERPTARFGSEIWVMYRQQKMFHAFLPPARAATREISEAAVEQVLSNISQRELERLTTRNPDLGPEEL